MSYNSKYKGKELEEVLDSVETKENILKAVYPVGSIYMSMVDTNPSVLFGFGTWERIKDRFLLSAGDTYDAGSTGGEAEHTLTESELAVHTHKASDKTPGTDEYNSYQLLLARNLSSKSTARVNVAKGEDYKVVASNPSASDYGGNNDMSYDAKTGSGGGGLPHNNMPPYLVVYIWRRTA